MNRFKNYGIKAAIAGAVLGSYIGLSNLVAKEPISERAVESRLETTAGAGMPYQLSTKAAAGATAVIGGLAALLMYGTLRINKKRK